MAHLVLVGVFLVLVGLGYCQEPELLAVPSGSYPLGDVRNCPVSTPHDDSQALYRMEVLPGVGFDNLRNLDMGQVHDYNFSKCQISKDGKYLLPDSIFLLPVQESKVDSVAEYFDHWDNHTSMTSNSINTEASFFSKVSGKFSTEYSTTKSLMYSEKSKSTRVQIRHKLYTVKLQPDAQLHPTFRSRLYDIASNIQNNNTEYASYLAELTIRDYGTHYVTSMDAGAILSQSDFFRITDTSDSSQQIKAIKVSASANFFSKISLSSSFQHSTTHADASLYEASVTHSQIATYGGPPFTPNLTVMEWEKGVPNALVAIDRTGNPLHFSITPNTLPRLPEDTIRAVSASIKSAINRYYRVNTRHGCTNPSAPNFNFHANLDDSTCKAASTNFTFGGLYQTCSPHSLFNTENLCLGGPEPAQQINPLTGGLSCPTGFTAVLLHSGSVSHLTHKTTCEQKCKRCYLVKHCCHCDNVWAPFLSIAHYTTYWCAALGNTNVRRDQGYLFGGFYNSKVSNPVTNSMSCPRSFIPLHMGEDTKVCVSVDIEEGSAYAVDFAGFDSCSVGNPMAHSAATELNKKHWPHLCPHGYAQHLVAVQDGCEINFCIRTGAFQPSSLYVPRLPPFRKIPKYKNNVTDTLVMFGLYGSVWVKNDDGGWDKIDSESDNGLALLANLDTKPPTADGVSKELPGGGVAAISIVSTVVLGVLIAVVVFLGRWAFKRRKGASASANQGSYVSIEDSAEERGPDPSSPQPV